MASDGGVRGSLGWLRVAARFAEAAVAEWKDYNSTQSM
jgi:hypothetical protein